MKTPIYLDYHATTPCDPRVVEAMLPLLTEVFGNPGSVTHAFGRAAREAVEHARECIASAIGAAAREIVFTSGATESNNLALRGVALRHAGDRGHILSVATEHRAVLDPLARLGREGFDVTLLGVLPAGHPEAGRVRLDQFADAMRPDTILVSVMLANNEIGAIQPIEEIGALCRQRGVIFHCDATQAVGKIPVDVDRLGVDLMSFSAHKIYGPKGVGALFVRRRERRVKLVPLIDGGGQERGLRSGTLNPAGIVGLSRALELCLAELPDEAERLAALRDRLWERLRADVPGVVLNGPALAPRAWRLPGNLNVGFPGLDGETLLLKLPDLALSSGSACTSAEPEPSHVLRALGLSEAEARSSLRAGLGRFTTRDEIDHAARRIAEEAAALGRLGGLDPA